MIMLWKDIKDYEGKYQVSNSGNIRSLSYDKTKKEKMLSPGIMGRGYKYVNLCKNGKKKRYYIHRLVAEAFIPNPNNYPVINHKDNNPSNNKVNNLEWCTQGDNIRYAYKCGKEKIWLGKFGKEHSKSKMVIQYDLKGIFVKEWDCISDIERRLKISGTGISNCCRDRQKTAGGFKWKYKKGE